MDEILKSINVNNRTNVTTIDLNPNNEPDIESNYTKYIDNLFKTKLLILLLDPKGSY